MDHNPLPPFSEKPPCDPCFLANQLPNTEKHPLHGTWEGVMRGFAALGAEEDEIPFSLTVTVDEDGNISATAEVRGESDWPTTSLTIFASFSSKE